MISDGDDNQSRLTRDEAASEALKSGVLMFTLSTHTRGPYLERGDKTLKEWATVTGGKFFPGLTRKDAPGIFAKIAEAMDGLYYASYLPPASTDKVQEIEVKPAAGEKLELSYPKGYFWVP